MSDRIGIRSFLVAEGDVHVETLVLVGFLERKRRPAFGDLLVTDEVMLPLMPRSAFPDDLSRSAYTGYMEDRLRRELEERLQ